MSIEKPWEGLAYWNPLPYARQAYARPPRDSPDDPDLSIGSDRPDISGWEAKRWETVPGPFFTGQTDTCGTGMLAAPDLVMFDIDWAEIVYRQPTTPKQVEEILGAAAEDPFGGYSWDGDKYWTPELVRGWWAERGRIREFLEQQWRESGMGDAPIHGPADRFPTDDGRYGLVRYAADLAGPLEQRLRGYLFWLLEAREPRLDETLPEL